MKLGTHTVSNIDGKMTVDGVANSRLDLLKFLNMLQIKSAPMLPMFTFTFYGTGMIMCMGNEIELVVK